MFIAKEPPRSADIGISTLTSSMGLDTQRAIVMKPKIVTTHPVTTPAANLFVRYPA
jgi:hypothetical protein